MITRTFRKQYFLQYEVLKLMTNYKRQNGLTYNDKILLKNINRYFSKLELLITSPGLGDVVIDERNINIYRKRYTLK